jgi:hypothetical protein
MNLAALYRQPPASSTEAFRVWIEACIPYEATVHDIAVLLDSWAREYCTFTIVEGEYHACWLSATGTCHDVPYEAIVHWMLCAATPVKKKPPVSSPPLQPLVMPEGIYQSSSEEEFGLLLESSSSAADSAASSTSICPTPVPDSKPKCPKPQRPDTPRPTTDGPLFMTLSDAQ